MAPERALFSLLWPKNHTMLSALVRRGYRSIAGLRGMMTPLMQAAVSDAGGTVVMLDDLITEDRVRRAAAAGDSMVRAIEQRLRNRPLSLTGWRATCSDQRLTEVVLKRVQSDAAQMHFLIEGLRALGEQYALGAVVVNETTIPFSRLSVRWAAAHGVPAFLMSHSSSLNDEVIPFDVVPHRTFVFGERGVAPALVAGMPRDHVCVTGNPAWDEYPQLLAARDEIRRRVNAECGFAPALPTVMFGPTWMDFDTRLQEDDLFGLTTRAFLKSARILQERGFAFNCVVKDRISNAGFGADAVAAMAREEGVADVRYAPIRAEFALFAADVVLSHESNLFVEAMICGVPAINIWSPSSWLMGASFGADDGIPFVSREEPARVADLIQNMIQDQQFRRATIAAMKGRAEHFHGPIDGRAGERCAELIERAATASGGAFA